MLNTRYDDVGTSCLLVLDTTLHGVGSRLSQAVALSIVHEGRLSTRGLALALEEAGAVSSKWFFATVDAL